MWSFSRVPTSTFAIALLLIVVIGSVGTSEERFESHSPMRPLPKASQRPLPATNVFIVDT
jgi:hypothetical protein